MGLDMYAYNIRKARKSDLKILSGSDIYPARETTFSDGFALIHADEDTEDLAEIADKVTLKCPYLDDDKIKRCAKIPKEWELRSECVEADGTVKRLYTFKAPDEEEKKGVVLTPELIKRFTAYEDKEFYPVSMKEVGYWRKDYDLSHKMYEAYEEATGKTIENCGYHRCSQEMLDALGIEEMPSEGAVFYHEWY